MKTILRVRLLPARQRRDRDVLPAQPAHLPAVYWATAYRISLVLHTFAACVWLYLFGLAVGFRVLPSLLLAMCVGAGGTVAAHQIHLNVVLGLSLGFFTLWLATQWSRSDRSMLWVLGGAVGAGLAMLGGQPPYLWPGVLMTLVYLVVVTLRGGAHPICRLPRLLGRGIAVAAGGILLAGTSLCRCSGPHGSFHARCRRGSTTM